MTLFGYELSELPVAQSVKDVVASPQFRTFAGISVGIGLSLFAVAAAFRINFQNGLFDNMAKMIKTDFSGKTILITGGNSGVGLATAIEMAKLNCNVIITVRSHKKGQTAVSKIKDYYPSTRTDVPTGNVSYKILDNGDLTSVNKFIDNILSEYKSNSLEIDYLVLNAGIFKNDGSFTKNNMAKLFQVNYFSHWLITYKFYDMFKQLSIQKVSQYNSSSISDNWYSRYGAPIRIISTSSQGHAQGGAQYGAVNYQDENSKKKTRNLERYFELLHKKACDYPQSKLLQILHMNRLQKLYNNDIGSDKNIWCCSFAPGMTRTGLMDDVPLIARVIMKILYPYFYFLSKDTRMASQNVLHCIGNNDPNIAGGYIRNCLSSSIGGSSTIDNDGNARKAGPVEEADLWDRSVALAGSL